MYFIILCLTHIYPFLTTAITIHKENNACPNLFEYPLKDFVPSCYVNPNVLASTPQMIELHGYKYETYETDTEDGYKLTTFRIPPQIQDDRKKGQPVVLEHGVQVNSAVWTWRGNKSLAFVLANAGYDVWLINQRDSGYTSHIKYKVSDYNFWNSSLDSVASKGLPAIFNTVVETTNKSGSIIYIGHSRGSTLAFMYGSENPKEAEKNLRGVVALAPIVYLDPIFYIKIASYLAPLIGKVLQILRIPALNYPVKLCLSSYHILCINLPHVCKLILALTSGSASQFASDDLLAFFSFFPYSISVKHLLQYAQMIRSKRFEKYDYGKEGNMAEYQQEQPPLYNLSNFKLPVYMFYGKRDTLIKEKGVKRAFEEIGSSEKEYFSVPIGINDYKLRFGHNDFCWSRNIEEFFYMDLFRVLDKLQPKE